MGVHELLFWKNKMTKLSGPFAVLFLFALATPGFSAELIGELVDRACYMEDSVNNVGVGHQNCAGACALKGQPVALVTDNGEVYTVIGELTEDNSTQLVPHMSHRVVLSGEIIDSGGKKSINATEVTMAVK